MNLLWLNQKTDLDDSGLGVAIDWIEAFSKNVDRLVVLTHHAGRLPEFPHVAFHSIGREKGYSEPRRLLEFYRQLYRVLRSETIDACFVHMVPVFGALAAPILRARGIPMVQWYAHRHIPIAMHLSYLMTDRTATCSIDSIGLQGARVVPVGHGIDTDRFRPDEDREKPQNGPFTILSLGRLSPIKRLDVLIEACARLRRDGFDFRLFLVGEARGEGPVDYESVLRELVERVGLTGLVEFTGPVTHAETLAWYHRADLFVNLCDQGSMDKAVLEAMACETPVITTNTAFKSFFDGPGWQGFVPRTEAVAVAEAIRRYLEAAGEERDEERRARRAMVVEDHGLNRFVDKILHIFRTVEGSVS